MIRTQKICFFNCTPFWGGGEKLHLEYAIEFKKLGYPVCVVAKQGSPFHQSCIKESIDTEPVTISNLSFLNPIKQKKLIRYFQESAIHTVFISASPDLKIAAFAAKKAGVKNIIYLRGLAAPVKASGLNRKLFLNTVTHIIANSKETKLKLTEDFNNKELENKVKVIYHGIDLEFFDKNLSNQNPVYTRKADEIILGNAGRLTKQKGQEYLIAVAKNLEKKDLNFKILIAGSGEEEQKIRELISKNKLNHRFELLGFVKDMEGFMKSIDVFLLTSVWEGFGYVIVEAMAARKPVVAFNITSNPEIIEQKETGYLIEFPNTESFSEKVLEIASNQDLMNKMGIAGRERIEKNFQLNNIIKEIEDYIFK